MSWGSAVLRALLIVAYFAVVTVWLPSFLLRLGAVSRADQVVQDVLSVGVWAAGLFAGMWALRVAQRRGVI